MLEGKIRSHWLTRIDMLGLLARWVDVLGGSLARNTLARRDSDVKTVGMIRWEWDTEGECWLKTLGRRW